VAILKVHSRGKALGKDVDLEKIARRTPGFTGADLQNLMNEAAILAARRDLKEISKEEIADALERIIAGPEKKGAVMSDKKRRLVAYHEAGHALVGALMPEYDPVTKISIVPRGAAGGLTFFAPSEERLESGLYSRTYFENQMAVALGGRIAEEIIFGEAEVTSGASGDLQQVTGMARQMVINYGMSDIGPWSLLDPSAQSGDVVMRMMARNSMSENLQQRIDDAVKKIAEEAYEVALQHIRDNREAIDRIVEDLLEKETLTGDEMRAILSEYTTIPEENIKAAREMEEAKEAVAA